MFYLNVTLVILAAESSSLLQPIRPKEKGGSLKYLHSKAMANESSPHLIIKLLIGEASRQDPPAASTTNQLVRKRSRRATGKMTEQSKLT